MKKIFLPFLLWPYLSFAGLSGGGGAPEGTAVKSTGQASGLVLTTQGDNTSAWGAVAGTGDVVGPSSSVANQVPVFNGTTGKAIKSPAGSDASNYFLLDHTNVGEQAYLHGDLNGALSYIVHNVNSGSSARSIISFGNDTGVNIFSVQANSTNWPTYPNTSMWASHLTNGSVFNHTQAAASTKWVLAGSELMTLVGTTGQWRYQGLSTTNKVEINPNGGSYFTASNAVNGTVVAAFNNSSNGASAYSEIDVNGNQGTLFFGHSSSGVSGTWIEGDQGYVLTNNSRGLLVGTIAGDMKFIVGGSNAAAERMRIKASGKINMTLPTYADDTAAGVGGLVAGDLYQQTTSHAVLIKQ